MKQCQHKWKNISSPLYDWTRVRWCGLCGTLKVWRGHPEPFKPTYHKPLAPKDGE